MRQKKKTEDSKLEQEQQLQQQQQDPCLRYAKLQNGRHSSFEETETPGKQSTLGTLKSVLKRSASSKKDKTSKTSKDGTSKKTKHRVQFDESQNKYFEADYVILIHEEDYDLDDYYDEGSPYDDEDDEVYDEGMMGPKICCSNPNCNNMITLTNYPEYGYSKNGLMSFKYPRVGGGGGGGGGGGDGGVDREHFDFSSQYYEGNFEEINQNTNMSSTTDTTNRCENEKCQNCNNYFDFEVSPKLETSQDFSDQVTLSPPEGYKDGGSHYCPHHGLQFHNSNNDISQKGLGTGSMEFHEEDTHGCDVMSETSGQADNQSDDDEKEDKQAFIENDVSGENDGKSRIEKLSADIGRIGKSDDINMQQEEKPEKLKQRFIVETITMTTVTERRIVREASESNVDETPAPNVNDLKKSGILKGGKFWRNSTEKPPGKTVNYDEAVNFKEGGGKIDEIEEEAIPCVDKTDQGFKITDEHETKSFELELEESSEEIKKQESDEAVSPESTELTLTFKLGQHLLVANSLKPNSAMRQLFPSPRFLSPPPLEDGEGREINKPIPPKQFLVTAESLRLFEEAKKSKILGNMNSEDPNQSFIAIMPPVSQSDEDIQNNRLARTIERNTLRRSLIKYSYEYRNKRLSEKKKNENSLEERIRQLTCGIDDEEPQEEKKDESEIVMPPRSSPPGEESKEPANLLQVDVKNLRHGETASPSPNSSASSGSSTYKKLTDLFSRKPNPPPILEDINRNIKYENVNAQCDLVLNSQGMMNNYALNSQGHRNSFVSAKNVARISSAPDSKKQFLPGLGPLTACVNAENKEGYRLVAGDRCHLPGEDRSEYSLQDIDEGLKESDRKKLGIQPDVIAETPQNDVPNDELALFVQQDAGRIEKLKKRYSVLEDKSDDDDDYGFNKRPLVRGIKQTYSPANETVKQVQSTQTPGSVPPNVKPTPTTTSTHTTWPYYSQENVDPKVRNFYQPKLPDESDQHVLYGNPQEYRGHVEMGNATYVELQGQKRFTYMNQAQQNVYSTTNTVYRCQPGVFAGGNYSELSNYQFRHPPHSPPPVRRFMGPPQPSPIPSEDGRMRNVENRPFINRTSENFAYAVGTLENRTKVGPPEVAPKVPPQPVEGAPKTSETIFHRRTVPNVHNPCLQMKFSPINYQQGAVPTASIRFSASCSPHPIVDESNVIIEPHYSTFPHPPNHNAVGVIRVGQGQQMIRVPVPYSTGAPVQVHLMAGRLSSRCDSPQRPSSPQGGPKIPVQPFNQYLIAKGTQTAQAQPYPAPTKPIPDGAAPPVPVDTTKTVDFEKQGKAIAEELQSRQKIVLSKTLSQENNYQGKLPPRSSSPVNSMPHQERGVPEGAASTSVQDSQPGNPENTPATGKPPPGNTIYYTMNV